LWYIKISLPDVLNRKRTKRWLWSMYIKVNLPLINTVPKPFDLLRWNLVYVRVFVSWRRFSCYHCFCNLNSFFFRISNFDINICKIIICERFFFHIYIFKNCGQYTYFWHARSWRFKKVFFKPSDGFFRNFHCQHNVVNFAIGSEAICALIWF